MSKIKKIFLIFCAFFTNVAVAQTAMDSLILNSKKIDSEILKQQSSLIRNSRKIDFELEQLLNKLYSDCDYLYERTPEELSFWLQEADSQLKEKLNKIIESYKNDNETDGALAIKKIELTQELWERYRHAYCIECFGLYGKPAEQEVLLFLRCALELTFERWNEIEKACDY